jgi:hypothetical protein
MDQRGVVRPQGERCDMGAFESGLMPLPAVSFESAVYTVTESVGSATLTVTLSAPSAVTVTVQVAATLTGTASPAADYTPISATLSFTPGVQVISFTIPITNDGVYESDETVFLDLSNPSGATLGAPLTTTLTIVDDEPLPTVQFSSAAYAAAETAGSLPVTVTLSGPSAFTVQVNLTTANGTAGPGDFAGLSLTLAFTPGVTSLTAAVTLTDDLAVEGSETFTVGLSLPINAALGAPSQATATILDNEAPATHTPTATATATATPSRTPTATATNTQTATPTTTATPTEPAPYRLYLPLVDRGPPAAPPGGQSTHPWTGPIDRRGDISTWENRGIFPFWVDSLTRKFALVPGGAILIFQLPAPSKARLKGGRISN